MWDIVKELATILGGAGILVFALTYLAKRLITHWMDKEVESHKAALQAQNDKAIEQLRSALRQQSLEHEVKYRRTDEKIADRLEGVYVRLQSFYSCISDYIAPVRASNEPSREDLFKKAQKASEDFWDYLDIGRLYIPAALSETTEAFATKLTDITIDFKEYLNRKEQGRLEESDVHVWSNTHEEIRKTQAAVLSSLLKEFQQRLGVFDLEEEQGPKEIP